MMTFHVNGSARALAGVCALVALAALSPTGVAAGSTITEKPPGSSVPASPHTGTTGTSTTTPTTTTAAPASGAQPGTVAPGSTPTTATPTTSVPTTAVPPTTPAATTPSATTPPTATPGAPTVVGVSRKASPSTHLSTGALALAILGALLALGCAVWVVGRWMALEPRWTISMMHSLREASYRASATWAEFSDWAKLGH